MDPVDVNRNVRLIVQLYTTGNVPETNFSTSEIEGRLAAHLGKDMSPRQVSTALGAIGVRRKSPREWDHQSFIRLVAPPG